MILSDWNPQYDIYQTVPSFTQGLSQPHVPHTPIWPPKSNTSGMLATPRRLNECAPQYNQAYLVNWNSGYWQAVLVGKQRRHLIVCQHFFKVVQSQTANMRFLKEPTADQVHVLGTDWMPQVEKIHWNAYRDTVVLRLKSSAPDGILEYPICDMRYSKPGQDLLVRTNQSQLLPAKMVKLFTADGIPSLLTMESSPGVPAMQFAFSGDSGTPVFCVLKDGRLGLAATQWSAGCFSPGTPTRLQGGHDPNDWGSTSPHAPGWDRFLSVFAEVGDSPEVVYPGFHPADLDSDGVVGPKDLAIMQGAWGTNRYDLNADGTVDSQDLGILLGNWGNVAEGRSLSL